MGRARARARRISAAVFPAPVARSQTHAASARADLHLHPRAECGEQFLAGRANVSSGRVLRALARPRRADRDRWILVRAVPALTQTAAADRAGTSGGEATWMKNSNEKWHTNSAKTSAD